MSMLVQKMTNELFSQREENHLMLRKVKILSHSLSPTVSHSLIISFTRESSLTNYEPW